MRKVSIYNLPPGTDKAQLIREGELQGFMYLGVHFYERGVVTAPHAHEDHEEVFINVQGKGKVVIDGKEFEFKAGDIVIIQPGEVHQIISDDVDPLVNIYLGSRCKPCS